MRFDRGPLPRIDPRWPLSRRRTFLFLLPVAWGVLLFGAVYPWAYSPLLVGISLLGCYGWCRAESVDREPARQVWPAFALLIGVALLQLVPLPHTVLERLSPGGEALLQRYDVAYATERLFDGVVTHPLSIAPGATVRGLLFLVSLSVFTLGCTALLPRIRLGLLVRGLAALGATLAVFGIVQRATFNDRIYWVWEPVNVAANAFGPFVNRNHFAGWMVMTAALTGGYLVGLLAAETRRPSHRSWRDRAAWLSSASANRLVLLTAALVLMTLAIVSTRSRSGIAATAVAGLLLAQRASSSGRGKAPLRGAPRIVAACAFVGALGLGIVWRGAGDLAAWYARTDTLAWRLQLWSDTMPVVRGSWLFGTGLNTYGASMLALPLNYEVYGRPLYVREAHNDYLQILSEGGVVLVLATVVATLLIARGISRAFADPQPPQVYWIRTGAVVGMIAIAVQETVDFSLQLPGNAVLFALLIAIALHRTPQARVSHPE